MEDESKLIEEVNRIAASEFELIVVDTDTGVVYRRNTDWEWAGGNLYNPIGRVSRKTLENQSVFSERIHLQKDFWNEIKDARFEEIDWTRLARYI